MKTAPSEFITKLKASHAIKAKPKLIAEWNHNRYTNVVAENGGQLEIDNAFDPDFFPISSIVLPNRPNKSAAKLIVDEGTAFATTMDSSNVRYSLGSKYDQYRYWASQDSTDGSGNFPNHTDGISNTRPTITYSSSVKTNLIVIKVMNSWASPLAHQVQVKIGGSWTTISTNPNIQNDGSIRLYYNGTGWSSNESLSDPISIDGVRYRVDSLTAGKDLNGNTSTYTNNGSQYNTNGINSHLHLVEMSARLRKDLTDVLITCNTTLDLGEASDLYPIGTITSNVASLTLDNTNRAFDKNTTGDYAGLIHANVKFLLSYVYEVDEEVYEFKDGEWYAQPWEITNDMTANISCDDYSKFLKVVVPPQMMLIGLTFPQITRRLLDSVGFTNYDISNNELADTIPVFYTDGKQTIWEIMDDLAKNTQTAVYFDSDGVMKMKTREMAFDTTATPTWTFTAQKSEGILPDIISLDEGAEESVNKVTINYKTAAWESSQFGLPTTQPVWKPDGDLVVRSAPLIAAISDLSSAMYIAGGTNQNTPIWVFPFETKVMLESEMIGIYGKEYVYYDGLYPEVKVIYSIDEQLELDKKASYNRIGLNYYTGKLKIGLRDDPNYLNARGMENTTVASHNVWPAAYSVRSRINGSTTSGASGMTWLTDMSQMQMATGSNYKADDILVATIGAIPDTLMTWFGTRITFNSDSSRADQTAGLVLKSGSGEDGLYFGIALTPDDVKNNGLLIYSRKNDKITPIGKKSGYAVAGFPAAVGVDLDVKIVSGSLTVYVDGLSVVSNLQIPSGDNVANSGRFGMYVSGNTSARFNYLYAINGSINTYEPDDYTFYDRVDGGFVGDKLNRDWVYRWKEGRRKIRNKNNKVKYRQQISFFDEFGPYVHEVRDFDVKFDPFPTLFNSLFMSSDFQAMCPDYNSTPFGATFRVVNTSRKTVILNGADSELDANVSGRAIMVLGRALEFSEDKTAVGQNDASIAMNGLTEASMDATWIQSEEMANRVIDWMNAHWSVGLDTLTLEVFGNPLLEPTDVVSVGYNLKNIFPETHQYFVTSVKNSFESGLQTTVELRRRVAG